jgi:hypothetical protein
MRQLKSHQHSHSELLYKIMGCIGNMKDLYMTTVLQRESGFTKI